MRTPNDVNILSPKPKVHSKYALSASDAEPLDRQRKTRARKRPASLDADLKPTLINNAHTLRPKCPVFVQNKCKIGKFFKEALAFCKNKNVR
jgi:hypothetical protein